MGLTAPALSTVRAACAYEGLVRTAVTHLKFRRARYLSVFLARLLAASLERRPLEADLVVPVPLHSSRQLERGFNQSELIGRELSRLVRLPAPSTDLLRRSHPTRPQVGLAATERRRNLREVFTCLEPERVMGQRCLLLDDVMTTGATLEGCAEALARAGAARVFGLVVAREL